MWKLISFLFLLYKQGYRLGTSPWFGVYSLAGAELRDPHTLAKTRACNTAFPVTCLTSFLKNNDKTLSRSEIHGLTSKTMRPTENNPEGADQQTVTETHGHHWPRLRSPGAVCILRSSARVWLCLVSNSVSLEQHRMHSSMPGSFQLIFCI